MPLNVVHAADVQSLWRAFSRSVLGELEGHRGPDGYPAAVWLTHRLHRDRLYEDAAHRGVPGWLSPPISFFSELPERFGFQGRQLGLLERRVLLDRIIARLYEGDCPPGLGAGADQLFAELLPEGTTPEQLEAALRSLPADDFGLDRNRRLVELLREYLAGLDRLGRYDARAVHAQVAARIRQGGLPAALGGARHLHIYGLTTRHNRIALLDALAEQADVAVMLYLLEETTSSGTLRIQPAPDEHRELEFVALEVKRLILEQRTTPRRIAVVARTGREDARMAWEALDRAGVPASGRIRTTLDEVPALKALMLLIRGAATDWSYRTLRNLLESSYFELPVNLRAVDTVAAERRIVGLAEWKNALPGVAALLALGEQADRLKDPRPLREWAAITREILNPGWFGFRERICRAPGDRWDLVRLDQQGVRTLESLLLEWGSADPEAVPISIKDWYNRLRRFLGANELALSTPLRNGVQVLEAHEAALVPFDHLFLLHANDAEFPKAYRSGGLLTESEREALATFGLPVAHRQQTLQRERALWNAVTSGAATTITYRTADASGVPLLPSLLVPSAGHQDEIPRVQFVWNSPFTRAHADREMTRRFGQGRLRGGGAFASQRRATLAHGVLASVAESRRLGTPDGSREPGVLGPWNGEIRDPVLLEELERRFGADYLWSASQLEKYAQNPFMFLLQRILRIEEQEEAEEDTTVLATGSIGHALLESFYVECHGRLPMDPDVASAELDRIAAEVFAKAEREGEWLGLPAMWGVRRRQVLENVRAYLAWELPRLKQWVPSYFEFSFGDDTRAAALLRHPDVTGEPVALKLKGKIDRVDAKKGGHRVVDYKSGEPPGRKGYGDGATLQGALYMAALQAHGLIPVEAEYRSIRKLVTAARLSWGDDDTVRALTLAHSIPVRVRAGRFEPCAAESCEWKDYWPGGLALVRIEQVLAKGACRFDG